MVLWLLPELLAWWLGRLDLLRFLDDELPTVDPD